MSESLRPGLARALEILEGRRAETHVGRCRSNGSCDFCIGLAEAANEIREALAALPVEPEKL